MAEGTAEKRRGNLYNVIFNKCCKRCGYKVLFEVLKTIKRKMVHNLWSSVPCYSIFFLSSLYINIFLHCCGQSGLGNCTNYAFFLFSIFEEQNSWYASDSILCSYVGIVIGVKLEACNFSWVLFRQLINDGLSSCMDHTMVPKTLPAQGFHLQWQGSSSLKSVARCTQHYCWCTQHSWKIAKLPLLSFPPTDQLNP